MQGQYTNAQVRLVGDDAGEPTGDLVYLIAMSAEACRGQPGCEDAGVFSNGTRFAGWMFGSGSGGPAMTGGLL